jgi:predicted MFS family arabinose efflux permease
LAFILFRIGTDPVARKEHQTNQPLPGLTLKQAFKEWRLWLLCICLLPISYALGSTFPLLEQILGSRGFSAADAVALAALTGVAVLAGRIVGGILIDKFWAPGVAFVFMASPALALYLLASPDISSSTVRIAILMIGFGAGVEYDFLAYLVSKYFGMRSYSSIYGFMYAFFGCGSGFGTIVMASHAGSHGWSYALTVASVALLIGTVPLLSLGKYRSFCEPPDQNTESDPYSETSRSYQS